MSGQVHLGGDDVGALVMELGSSMVKGGYAGDDCPKAVFPAYAGCIPEGAGASSTVGGEGPASEEAAAAGSKESQWFTDLAMHTSRAHMEIKSPMTHGVVTDWAVAEPLLKHLLRDRLLADPKEHPLMMAESAGNTTESREKLTELMFEKFDAPAFFLSKDAVLSAFATGRATALVVDCGGGTTKVSPVHDGYILKKGVVSNKLGGDALTSYLTRQLTEQRKVTIKPHYMIEKSDGEVKDISAKLNHITSSYSTWMVGDVVRDLKESFCKASDVRYDPAIFESKPPSRYELPDGNVIEVAAERYLVPELLLQPDLGDEGIKAAAFSDELKGQVGMVEMINQSIHRCDPDIRRDLYMHVVLTGGGSLFGGLSERLTNELVLKVAQQKVKVNCPTLATERRFSAWIGGSILASLGTFHQLWMSKKEYEESGAVLVEKRCP